MTIIKGEERRTLIDTTVSRVLEVKKYSALYEPTVRRIVEKLFNRYPAKKLEKEVRRRLHRIWGAYFTRPDFRKLLDKIKRLYQNGASDKDLIYDLLKLQTSTDERLQILEHYYSKIFDITGIPDKVVEYGCGVNALTYPWMRGDVEYLGFDVDMELINFINDLLELFGYNSQARAALGDVLIGNLEQCDITMFLKVLILFERQESGIELEILRKVPSRYFVVSYPTQSISGRNKNMEENYRNHFLDLIEGESWAVEEVSFENELVFVVEKV